MNKKDCTHDNYHKDHIGGSHTGDYICDSCEEAFPSRAAADAASDAAHARLKAEQQSKTEDGSKGV